MSHYPPPTTNLNSLHDLLAQTEAVTQRWLDDARTQPEPPAPTDIACITLSVRRIALMHRDIYRLENPGVFLTPKPQPKSETQKTPTPSPLSTPSPTPSLILNHNLALNRDSDLPSASTPTSPSYPPPAPAPLRSGPHTDAPDRPYCIIPAIPRFTDSGKELDSDSNPDLDPIPDSDRYDNHPADYEDPMLWQDPEVAEHNRRFVQYLFDRKVPSNSAQPDSTPDPDASIFSGPNSRDGPSRA